MNPINTITFKDGSVLKIVLDESPESPREWDNNGTMVCLHNRYTLGDEHKHNYKGTDFDGWDELKSQIETDHDIVVILPLYLMDHSGLSIHCDNNMFRMCDSNGWDWGQVGFIFATREGLKKNGHPTDIDPKEVETWLRGEVETYDQYLRGDIYGFVLCAPPCKYCESEGKVIDSCWGFYGSDPLENGMLDSLSEEYRVKLKGELATV